MALMNTADAQADISDMSLHCIHMSKARLHRAVGSQLTADTRVASSNPSSPT